MSLSDAFRNNLVQVYALMQITAYLSQPARNRMSEKRVVDRSALSFFFKGSRTIVSQYPPVM